MLDAGATGRGKQRSGLRLFEDGQTSHAGWRVI